jgi:hypothetical protein
MSAIRARSRSTRQGSHETLVTLPDGRRMSYEEIVQDARQRRSEALGMHLRNLFIAITSSKHGAAATRTHSPFGQHRHA